MTREHFFKLTGSAAVLSFLKADAIFTPTEKLNSQQWLLTFYKDPNYGGKSFPIVLNGRFLNQVYPLHLNFKPSSVQWNLPPREKLIIYSEAEGQGTRYRVTGSDGYPQLHDHDNGASSFRVIIDSVPDVFDIVFNDQPRVLEFHNGGFRLSTNIIWSSKEHFQGIQAIDSNHIMITASDLAGAYFFIVKWDRGYLSREPGSVLKQVSIKNDFSSDFDFDHCSGIQILNGVAGIGLEYIGGGSPHNKPKGAVVFYDVSNPRDPKKVGPTISRPTRSAGTVGLVHTTDNRILMVVGGTDTLTLDFYFSTQPQNTVTNDTAFDPPINWEWNKQTSTRGWVDKNWGKYQSINLVRDPNGKIYLIGFNRADSDWVDLFEVEFSGTRTVRLKKISKKKIYCNNGVSLEYASGVHLVGDLIHFIASGHGRTTDNMIKLNYFS